MSFLSLTPLYYKVRKPRKWEKKVSNSDKNRDTLLTFSFGQSAGVGVNQSQLKMLQREQRSEVSQSNYPTSSLTMNCKFWFSQLSLRHGPLDLTRSRCWPWTWGPVAGGSPWPERSPGRCTAPPGMLWLPFDWGTDRQWELKKVKEKSCICFYQSIKVLKLSGYR